MSQSDEDQEYTRELTEFRAEKDAFFGSAPQSPIPSNERRDFETPRFADPRRSSEQIHLRAFNPVSTTGTSRLWMVCSRR